MGKQASRSPKARPLAGYRSTLERILFGVALLGVLTTVHLWIQQGRGFDRGCLGFTAPSAVEASFNCEAVVQSSAGQLFGISNAVLGLGFYLVVAALSAALLFTEGPRLRQLKLVRAGLITVGFLYSLYLIYFQYFVLGEFCALCLISALLSTLLFVLLAVDFFNNVDRTRFAMESNKRMREARMFASLAVLALLLVGADVLYFGSLEAPARPQQTAQGGASPAAAGEAECTYDPEKGTIPNYREIISASDPMRGTADAPVTVIEFFEVNCGHCRLLHPVMEEVSAKYADQAAFYFKPVVFWPDRSLLQTEALYVAAQEGKFFEMMTEQFEHQNPRTGLGLEQLQSIAQEVGMQPAALTQALRQGLYRNIVMRHRQRYVDEMGINTVPAVLINGRFVAGSSRNAECMGQLIEQAAR